MKTVKRIFRALTRKAGLVTVMLVLVVFFLFSTGFINISFDGIKEWLSSITGKKTVQQTAFADLDGPYDISKVVDGDTLTILSNGEKIKVRLIGVDTPESVASQDYLDRTGKENSEAGLDASAYVKELLDGKQVWFEYDAGREDRYGRVLAYVYFEQGGKPVMLNKHLLDEGLAQTMTIQPNVAHQDEFADAQTAAREAKRGFWALDNVF